MKLGDEHLASGCCWAADKSCPDPAQRSLSLPSHSDSDHPFLVTMFSGAHWKVAKA